LLAAFVATASSCGQSLGTLCLLFGSQLAVAIHFDWRSEAKAADLANIDTSNIFIIVIHAVFRIVTA
jgi:hypothetical protein